METNLKIDLSKIYDKSNLKWLEKQCGFVTLHGSHAYGTNRPGSDIDLRGVVIPPKEYYLGVLDNFEQATFNEPYDCVLFGINKFFQLAMNCNPNALELIFTDPSDHLVVSDSFQKVLDNKELFLSKKAKHTFAGYARSQLKRIQTHRKWILNPLEKIPEREDFGIKDGKPLIPKHKMQEINAEVLRKINKWLFDTTGIERDLSIQIKNTMYDILSDLEVNREDMHIYAARSIGLDDNLLMCFKKEHAFEAAMRDWDNYQKWKKNRNKERYEMEKEYGFDGKHGMHLVRLYKQCHDVLSTGKLVVKRPDAAELLEIRNGSWTYDELIEWADKQDEILNELYKTSVLPNQPNNKKLNQLLMEVVQENHE